MKILFVQLARLGDIYQTWPTLNATLRIHSDADVHLLVRERFQGATEGLDPRVKIHTLPSAKILGPFIREMDDVQTSIFRLGEFLQSLEIELFDRVVNLSYSPFSSYLTHYLQSDGSSICGYSRHDDGYFHIPDDVSAYFYAQVGIGRHNRYHLTEVFASTAGVDLTPNDWRIPDRIPFFERALPSEYLVIHPGASQPEKKWSDENWGQLIVKIVKETALNVVVVGVSGEDDKISEIICAYPERVLNLTGKTRVSDLLHITKWARLCVGGDSVIMHAASLSQTSCLNLSCQSVNFWETGPCSQGSEVIWMPEMSDINVDRVYKSILYLLQNESTPFRDNIRVNTDFSPVKYDWSNRAGTEFEWNLIKALYTGASFPVMDDPITFQAFYRLRDLSDLAIQAIQQLNTDNPDRHFSQYMDGIDHGIMQVGQLNASANIVVQWLVTEKLRIPPQGYGTLIEATLSIYSDFNNICRVFTGDETYRFEQGEIYAE